MGGGRGGGVSAPSGAGRGPQDPLQVGGQVCTRSEAAGRRKEGKEYCAEEV